MSTSKINRRYAWRPDLPDFRDVMFKSVRRLSVNIPPMVDLRKSMPPVYDQGVIGSCVANAVGAAYQYEQIKQKLANFIPSRLFIYFNARELEGSIKEDAGAMIRDGIKCVADKGVCPETEWAYAPSKFAIKPPVGCYTHALDHQVLSYQRLNVDIMEMKNCLASGYPFTFGFTVYENFESAHVAKNGMMDMPSGSVRGGHAVLAVGYDDSVQRMIIRNSWGNWGDKGYFYMPYAYIASSNLCDDFWQITTVEA